MTVLMHLMMMGLMLVGASSEEDDDDDEVAMGTVRISLFVIVNIFCESIIMKVIFIAS